MKKSKIKLQEMGNVFLFVNYFESTYPTRRGEYLTAMVNNIINPHITRIYVLGQDMMPIFDKKVVQIWCEPRVTYAKFFAEINKRVTDDDVAIIANLDIYFDDTLRFCTAIPRHCCYALSRWENRALLDRQDSQDSWIFKGPIRPIQFADFCMGTWGCDNRIAHELHHAGYQVSNPSHTIVSHHLHFSDIRQNETRTHHNTVAGPYKYIQSSAL